MASNPFGARSAPAFRYAAVHSRGRRVVNEDRYAVFSSVLGARTNTFYAVFDGHGGQRAAQFASAQLCDFVEKHWNDDDVAGGVRAAFLDADTTFLSLIGAPQPPPNPPPSSGLTTPASAHAAAPRPVGSPFSASGGPLPPPSAAGSSGPPKRHNPFAASAGSGGVPPPAAGDVPAVASPPYALGPPPPAREGMEAGSAAWWEGSTALMVLALGYRMVVAHVGDSRALLVRADGSWVQLTRDHSGSDADERSRIEDAGGFVDDDGRVGGVLDVTRGFGDARLKAVGVSAEPDVAQLQVAPPNDVAIILATDGLWKSMSNDAVAGIALTHTGAPPPSAAAPAASAPSSTVSSAPSSTTGAASVASAAAAGPPLITSPTVPSPAAGDDTAAGGTGGAAERPRGFTFRSVADHPATTTALPLPVLMEPRTIAERLVAEAQLRGATDNVTVLIVDLTRPTAATMPLGHPPST